MDTMDDRVFFKRPDYNLLKSLGQNAVDMHFHSQYSDTNVKISSIIKRAKKLGIGVAVTDHNEIAGAVEASRQKDVMIIPGMEVSCIEGPHILLYFYSINDMTDFYETFLKAKRNGNPYMATNANVRDVLDYAEGYSCIKVAAHPYGYAFVNSGLSKCIAKHYVDADVMAKINGIEAICGAMNRHLNRKAVKLARMTDMAITGGSDGHALFQLGRVVTSAHADNASDFLDSVREKKSIVVGKELRGLTKLIPVTKSIRAHMHYAIPSMKLQSHLWYGRALHFKGEVMESIKHVNFLRKI